MIFMPFYQLDEFLDWLQPASVGHFVPPGIGQSPSYCQGHFAHFLPYHKKAAYSGAVP